MENHYVDVLPTYRSVECLCKILVIDMLPKQGLHVIQHHLRR